MTTAAILELLKGHEMFAKAMVDGAGELFRLWLTVRQKRQKRREPEVVPRPRTVSARRIRPALGPGGKAAKRKGPATRGHTERRQG
jgi:hypothetical protein